MKLISKSSVLLSALLLLTAGALAAQEPNDPPGLGDKAYHGDDPDGGNGGNGVDCTTGENLVRVLDDGLRFDPETITIQAGESVTWCHDGVEDHNVDADDGSFTCANGCDDTGGDGTPDAGWKFSRTFDDPGDIPYHCDVHLGLGMTGTVIVEGDDGGGNPGTLQFRTGSYAVDENGGSVALHVERTGGTDGSVGVDVATSNGSATAGSDYTATSTTVSWGSGDGSTKQVMVPITNDSAVEGNETFDANLSNATGGASIGSPSSTTVTIRDDDEEEPDPEPGQLGFASFAVAGSEGGNAMLEVVRTGGSSGSVSADYQTEAGSAMAGSDFQGKSGTVNFGDGETTKSISVSLMDDGDSEPLESFAVTLSNPTGGASLSSLQKATVLVFDDEEAQQTLTTDEVICDEFRLAALLGRMEVSAPNTMKVSGLNASFTEVADFAGIAYTGNGPGTAEHHLAFSTNPEETTFLRNPARPQLFSISLTRNQTNSDLVPEGSMNELQVLLNPTLSENPDPLSLLTVDDIGDPVTRVGGTPAESKPGRGLADAVRLCHGKFTSRDQHVFRVLTKIARATADGAAVNEIAIFRAEGEDTYRLDVYPVSADGSQMGRLAVELEIDFGPGDRLDSGTLRVLSRCGPAQSANCTSVDGFTELQLVEPKFSGEFWNDSPYAVSTSGMEGDETPMSSVDFAALLEGTSWRRPL